MGVYREQRTKKCTGRLYSQSKACARHEPRSGGWGGELDIGKEEEDSLMKALRVKKLAIPEKKKSVWLMKKTRVETTCGRKKTIGEGCQEADTGLMIM